MLLSYFKPKSLPLSFFLIFLFPLISNSQQLETILQRSSVYACEDLAVSSDGLFLASIQDGFTTTEIEIWNTKTGHLARVINTRSGNENPFTSGIAHARFWRGSKFLITGTTDGVHEVYDLETGKKTKRLKLRSYLGGAFGLSEKTGMMAAVHPLAISRSALLFMDLYSNEIVDSVFLNVGGIISLDYTADGLNLVLGTDEGSFHILNLATATINLKADSAHTSKINYLQCTSDNYLLTVEDEKFILWNLATNAFTSTGKIKKGGRIVASPSEDCFFIMSPDSGLIKRSGTGVIQRSYGIQPDNIRKIDTDNLNTALYVFSDQNIRVFDLLNMTQTVCIKNESVFDNKSKELEREMSTLQFLAHKKSFIFQKKENLSIHPLHHDQKSVSIPMGIAKVNSIFESNTDAILISGIEKIKPFVSLLEGEKRATSVCTRNENIIASNKNGTLFIAVGNNDSLVHLHDTKTNKIHLIQFKTSIKSGAYIANTNKFIVGGDYLYVIDPETRSFTILYQKEKEDFAYSFGNASLNVALPNGYKYIAVTPNGKRAYAVYWLDQIKVWDIETGKIDTTLNLAAKSITFSSDGSRMYIGAGNTISIFREKDLKPEGEIALLENGEYVIHMPDHYYKSSRKGSQAIAFRKGSNTFSFEQFDIVFNRPDLVAKRLGSPDEKYNEAMNKAYLKRLKKMGINENQINVNALNVPEISFANPNEIVTMTKNELFKFEVKLKDDKSFLSHANAYINGVPFSSFEGYNFALDEKTKNKNLLTITFSILLEQGKNVIDVYCTNALGLESFHESFEIYYMPEKPIKPNLYILAIGAGEYNQKQFNLQFPAKDVTDISSFLKQDTSKYKNTFIKLLTNKDVTLTEIMKAKSWLQEAKVNDRVMIFWAGHGVLSKELDYYLATYDMDFLDPAKAGMSYSLLENLLDGISPRKKVIFIDACHSGELDKEEVMITNANVTADANVSFRNVSGVGVKQIGLENSFALMNETFMDVRRNSGADVISSAGGAEYAMEGKDWGYGVFAYAFLEGLKEKKADLNADGKIYLSELRTYLQEFVPELTKGKQKPTSRTENLVSDWEIWR